jgi:hypothetical protein
VLTGKAARLTRHFSALFGVEVDLEAALEDLVGIEWTADPRG